MGILVCFDEFTYDVVNDLSLECIDDLVLGYDNTCRWEKMVIEERPAPLQETLCM